MARANFEYNMTKDPKTGLVPRDELEKSRGLMSKMIQLMGAVPNVSWVERGPNDVGGRTRAIMWDPNDPTTKKVWAGGVSGGLWYNNDITDANVAWTKVDDFWDNIAIGYITYDPSNPQIMYVGTGERGGTSSTDNTGSSGTGGGGIWKSTNGGTNWTRLSSTIPDYTTNSLASRWREIFKIIVNSNGDIYALTYLGVYKSTNGGTSWSSLSGPNVPPDGYSETISDIELGSDGILYIAEGTGQSAPYLYKSTDNTISGFTVITPSGITQNGRVEIALAPSTSGANQVIYAVSANSGEVGVKFFKKSTNAGVTWTDIAVPTYDDLNGGGVKQFVGDQGSYDLILGTHETDPDILYAAAITMSITVDGGDNWLPKIGYSAQGALMHVDHHSFAARPGYPNEAVFGNDGGVYYSANWGNSGATTYPTFIKRNKNYNVTQFFSVDINKYANSGTVVAGAQDNGTRAINTPYNTIGPGLEVNSGDGGLTFIDKIDTTIIISNYTNVTPKLSKKGTVDLDLYGEEMDPQYSNRGKFINPADYDSQNHTLWHNNTLDSESDTKFFRYHIAGTSPNHTYTTSNVTVTGVGALDISFIKLGLTAGNMFIGTVEGDVYKVTGLNTSGNQTLSSITKIMDYNTTANGNVSSLDFGPNENTIVVTKSNYNIKSVFYTTDGGATWISKDETTHGLANVPIRYCFVNPVDPKQVFLATELGVWSTSDITLANPQWAVTNANLANVRCDMLKFRPSDNTLVVATHGRGVFSTKINQSNTPCPTTLVLISTVDDKNTGTTTFEASETIQASNKITGTANVNMSAGKSITLEPSTTGGGTTFEAANGTVFHAYIQGCNN
ncbi:hypothetical protein SAMN06298216_3436 [Spirosomataceae bacterium TFI 002]|nr:hypothetical protein SAMN06298216_3436 [Spirosomataceae bacterium TFI 002]